MVALGELFSQARIAAIREITHPTEEQLKIYHGLCIRTALKLHPKLDTDLKDTSIPTQGLFIGLSSYNSIAQLLTRRYGMLNGVAYEHDQTVGTQAQ